MPITVIELPHVGESVTEGVIGRWLKQPGDYVEKYDPLLEVVTDKVSMEVPSPYSGTLVKTLVSEGDTVPMGRAIAEMDVDEAATAPPPAPVRPEARGLATPVEAREGRTSTPPAVSGPASDVRPLSPSAISRNFEFMDTVRSVGPTGSGEGGQGRPDAALPAAAAAVPVRAELVEGRTEVLFREGAAKETTNAPSSQALTGEKHLSPLVRRLLAQHDVDVSQVQGTGMGGRITKDDVLRYVASTQTRVRASSAAAPPDFPDTSVLRLTPLRRTIAEHMARSVREIPAAWTMVEADVSGLVRWRTAHREAFEHTHGIPLTYLPAAAHAVAQALREHPRLNAQWDGDRILLHNRVHLGIAVSTEAGLVVPVVHDADSLPVGGLARRIAQLVEAARSQKLRLEDVQGGTFTLNNTGALGSVVSVPIINHPQAAILTTEAIVKRPVVVQGDAIAVRSMMNLCLTFDHRVCDGAEAAAFLQAVKSRLEAIDERSPLA